MLHHARAVSRGCRNAFLVGDMPFGSYECSTEEAVRNAMKYIGQGHMDAVKLEGGVEMAPTIKAITSVGVPVLGHIGLTPQRASSLSGFKVQGKNLDKVKKLLADAFALQQAGCFAIVLEAIPSPVATFITSQLRIPTIGIGAGPGTSGQVLVQNDTLGVFDRFVPKFCKQYATLGNVIVDALKAYHEEVKTRKFPVEGTHTYTMTAPEELERFEKWVQEIEQRRKARLNSNVHEKLEEAAVAES